MTVCPSCGQENPEGFRLCGMCGTPLAAPDQARETRKVVTIVFADVTGSTALGERLDPESLRHVMGRYFDGMSAVIERHGGTVEKFIGDAIMAVFGIPVVHEDDALRAMRAAFEMRSALEELNEELEPAYGAGIANRIGVNTGEVVAGDPATGQRFATGDAVNVAARLEQAASPGEILLGDETYRLVRDAVRVEPLTALALAGKAEPVPAFRLVEVEPGAPGYVRRLDTPLVGRGHELDLLRDAFARSARERACHLFTLLGAAGVGKSRLVAEFLALQDGARVARGRCLPYGEGITYWPVVEVVREAAGIAEDEGADAARAKLVELLADEPRADAVAQLVLETLALAEGAASTEETFWALRKLCESLARRRPLVLVLDDIQWGEATLLDLIEHLADWSRDAPILLLCMARPDLLDVRPGWGGGKVNATTVLLEPLDGSESERLVVHLLAEGDLEPSARARISEAAEGNPLFIEEMIGMLIDDGLLARDNGRWRATADLAALPVPPTIRALLAARLDQLGAAERTVIERAAVEGQVLHQGAVAALAPEASRVGPSLLALIRRELIRPDRPAFAGEEAFRFRHLLIRDAAYEALPKEARAELHERFAEWLERKAGEYPEIVGYHLEQAWRYRTELSPAEAHADLATRAGAALARAGRRAYAHGDVPAASRLLDRATTLLPRESEERLELLPILSSVLAAEGRIPVARNVLGEAIDLAQASGNRRVEWRARAIEGWWRSNMDPDVPFAENERAARRAVKELTDLGDDFGLAQAWRLQSDVAQMRGDGEGWIDALRRGFEHARRAGNRHEEWACLMIYGGAMFFSSTPAEEGIARLEAIRSEIGEDALLEAAVGRALGAFIALRGDVDDGRAVIERSRAILADLGHRWGLAGIPFMSGRIAALTGDLETAEREYRASAEAYAGMGERGRRSTIVAELAAVVLQRGRLDEAEALAEEAAALAAPEDVSTQAPALSVRGLALARRGDVAGGERLVRDALEMLDASDQLDQKTLTLLGLSEVLELAGRSEEARAAVERALELARQKGNVLLERRATERLSALGRTI